METASPAKLETPVLFVCYKWYEYMDVLRSDEHIAVDGRAIRVYPHRIKFQKKAYWDESVKEGIWRGEFVTRDPVEVDFIRESANYKKGIITEEPYSENIKRQAPEQVRRGAVNSRSGVTRPTPPAEQPPDISKARVHKSLRRGRPPKERPAETVPA